MYDTIDTNAAISVTLVSFSHKQNRAAPNE